MTSVLGAYVTQNRTGLCPTLRTC